FAKGGLLRVLRTGMPYLARVSAVLGFVTGLYLTWYWYAAIAERDYGSFVSRVERWQSDLATFLQRQGAWKLALVFGAVIALAVVIVRFGGRRNGGVPRV
ncbi:MAG: hypothetical protein ACKOA5_14830, partial [Actinomycetota bacterium]